MRRLEDQRSPRDDIEDAEFTEVDDEPAYEPPHWASPPPPPTLGDWWRDKGFFVKTLIIFTPLLFLAMCMAAVGDAPQAAVEISDVERKADAIETVPDSPEPATQAVEPDFAAAGPPTCTSIEGEISNLLAKNSGKAVLEINNKEAQTVDDFPRCYGTAMTEAGTIFIAYGIQLSPKGQPYLYVRQTLDVIIPPGMENTPIGPYAAPAEARQDEVAPQADTARPAPNTTPTTAPPTSTASSRPTDEDVYAPHP